MSKSLFSKLGYILLIALIIFTVGCRRAETPPPAVDPPATDEPVRGGTLNIITASGP